MKNPVEKRILPIFSKESKSNAAPFWKTLPPEVVPEDTEIIDV